MTDKTKAKLKALLDDPFPGYGLTEKQKNAATWLANGYNAAETARLLFASPQAINWHLTGARKKIGLDSNRDFTKHLMKQIKAILK